MSTEQKQSSSNVPKIVGGGLIALAAYFYLTKDAKPGPTNPGTPVITPQPPASSTSTPQTPEPATYSNMSDSGRTNSTDQTVFSPTWTMKSSGTIRAVKVRCSLIKNMDNPALLATLLKNGNGVGQSWMVEESEGDLQLRDRTIVFSPVEVKAGDTINLGIGTLGPGRIWEQQLDSSNQLFTSITVT